MVKYYLYSMWPFKRAIETKSAELPKQSVFFYGQTTARWGVINIQDYIDEGFVQNVITYRCINSIANLVAAIPMCLYTRNASGKVTEVESHPSLDLLQMPSNLSTFEDFTEALISYYYITGNAYALAVGKPGERIPKNLEVLPSQYMEVKAGDKLNSIKEYEFRSSAGFASYPVDQLSGYSDIFHFKNFNPRTMAIGMSGIAPAAFSIDIYNELNNWNKSTLQNGARPSGALVVNNEKGEAQNLTDEQFVRLKAEMEDQYQGSSNAGRPMLLEGGLDWKPMSYTPEDMMMLENKQETARDIARAFNYPPMLLGIPGDSTYSNLKEAKGALYDDVVIPLSNKYARAMSRWLLPRYGAENMFFMPDIDQLGAIQDRRMEKMKALQEIDFITMNEKRQMVSFDDTGGGDTIYIDSTKIPLDMSDDDAQEARDMIDAQE